MYPTIPSNTQHARSHKRVFFLNESAYPLPSRASTPPRTSLIFVKPTFSKFIQTPSFSVITYLLVIQLPVKKYLTYKSRNDEDNVLELVAYLLAIKLLTAHLIQYCIKTCSTTIGMKLCTQKVKVKGQFGGTWRLIIHVVSMLNILALSSIFSVLSAPFFCVTLSQNDAMRNWLHSQIIFAKNTLNYYFWISWI